MSKTEIVKKRIPAIRFRSGKLSKNTLEAYTQAAKGFYLYCQEQGIEPGTESARAWLNTFENAKTFNLRRIALKEHLLKLYEDEPADRQLELIRFFESIRAKQVKKAVTTDYLTFEQIETLVKTCKSKEMQLVIWSLFWSGARITELLNIKLNDCRVNGTVIIRIVGKGSKEREVYLPHHLFKKIRATFAHCKVYLFETKNNTQFNKNNISEYIRRAGKRLDLTISAHTLRHSKAMYLKDVQHLSPDEIAKALGHSSVVTTLDHYFHGTPSAEKQGIK